MLPSDSPLENKKHFRLNYESINIIEKEYQHKGGFNPERGLSKRDMNAKIKEITEKEEQKIISYDKTKYYFVINLTIPITSNRWKSLQEEISARIVHIYNEKTIKIAIDKKNYLSSLDKIINNRKFIKNIQHRSSVGILTEKLEKAIRQHDDLNNVTIETIDLSGIKNPVIVVEELRKILDSVEEIYLGYHNNQKAILKGTLKPSSIGLIVDNIETVFNVDNAPKLNLNENYYLGLEKYLMSDKVSDSGQLPINCIVDSGINKSHKLLQKFISETYNYFDQDSEDCIDDTGHGSMVSSIAIYKDKIDKLVATSAIIMVKIFEKDEIINISNFNEEIDILNDIIQKFKSKTKVFNFSFSSAEKNTTWSRTLDDIVYDNDISLVVCAGNILPNAIAAFLNSGKNYPLYILDNEINFPGDCDNVITVGSYTKKHSDLCEHNQPSPFTKSGNRNMHLKPDILDEGGNLRLIKDNKGFVINLDERDLGIKGASNEGSQIKESIGTSLSTPAIANLISQIYKQYPDSNPYLVKAMLLSSSEQLNLSPQVFNNPNFIQGFGVPIESILLYSVYRRASYLLQGTFEYVKPIVFHRYYFYFPRNANRLIITFAIGKPSGPSSYIKYRLIRGGSSSFYKPAKHKVKNIGSKGEIYTTHKKVIDVDQGGKGEWIIEIIPHIKDVPTINNSIKYGCVITIESTKNNDVYTEIAKKNTKLNIVKKNEDTILQPAALAS